MEDLNSSVPVLDRHSQMFYSIINKVHWYEKMVQHSAFERVWCYTLKQAYTIEGRYVVKNIKNLL